MKGTIQVRQLDAACLVGNPLGDPTRRPLPVYLPPGYEQTTARYPVVYFLHPFTGSAMTWLNAQAFSPTVPERLDRLIDEGLPPFIGVFPDGWTAFGGSQWRNSEATGRYRDYFVRDVVGFVDRELRTVPRAAARAVAGRSSGGYGALLMGWHHSDVFAHLAAHSADAFWEYCYLPELPRAANAYLKAGGVEPWYRAFKERAMKTRWNGDDHIAINILAMCAAYSPRHGEPLGLELPMDLTTGRLKDDVWARWLPFDPVRFVPRHAGSFRRLASVFVDCGSRDEFNLHWGARMLAEAFHEAGIEHVHEEYEDGHQGTNYRFDRSLNYIAPRLARE